MPRPGRTTNANLRDRATGFAGDEDGSLIIFGLFIFTLMMVIGGLSLDLMRYETARVQLQGTADRAALAAASLTQSLDPTTVVNDYFAKANMTDYLDSVDVVEGFNYRKVTVNSSANVPLHFGNFSAYNTGGPADLQNTTLQAQATGVAEESIGNVEISLVLDVSGSMNWYSRLTNLKSAASDFIDTVYGAADDGAVSTSVIPYATQVNAGATLLSHYTLAAGSHSYSHCVNFTTSDFSSAALSTSQSLEQTLHFDPWSGYYYAWSLNSPLTYPVCATETSREILPWSKDATALKAYVNAFVADGNTSTDIGLKWGAALLDPGSQPVLTSMIASGDVDPLLAGRPSTYTSGDTLKIIVVMSDGVNTAQYYMSDPYRTANSRTYIYNDGSTDYFSVWGGTGEPDMNPPDDWYCTYWYYGYCYNWAYGTPQYWYYPHNGTWNSAPYGGATNATRMTYSQLWAKIPVSYYTDSILYAMGISYTERSAIWNAVSYVPSTTKDTRMSSICTAAKAEGVMIFSVGLEVSSSSAAKLRSCASSAAHYYDVTGLDISYAFQSIASQINQLKLTQ